MVPTKKRRSSPARVNSNNRNETCVVEPKPATILVISRSMIRITPSSERRWRSRSWSTTPRRLFPAIEYLLGPTGSLLVTAPDIRFDFGAAPGPARPAAVIEVRVVRVGFRNVGYQDFLRSV